MHGMQLSVEFTSADGSLKLRASGSQVAFAGYLKAFEDFDTGKEGSSGKHTAFKSAFGSAFGLPQGLPIGLPSGLPLGLPSELALGLPLGVPLGLPLGLSLGLPLATDFM